MKKNNKILISLASLITIILIIILSLEVSFFSEEKRWADPALKEWAKLGAVSGDVWSPEYFRNNPTFQNSDITKQKFRPPVIGDPNKPQMIILGCSLAKGFGLYEEETLANKISKLTNRTVFNLGVSMNGPQNIHNQLSQPILYQVIQNADTLIYVFDSYQLQKMYYFQPSIFEAQVAYRLENKNGELKEVKPILTGLYKYSVIKRFQTMLVDKKIKDRAAMFDLFKQIMNDCQKMAQQHYPNAKFVILVTDDKNPKSLTFSEIKQLEDMGFIVLKVSDLTTENLDDPSYHLIDRYHPSSKYWDAVATPLVQKLGIQ